jgi:hypothetical protein
LADLEVGGELVEFFHDSVAGTGELFHEQGYAGGDAVIPDVSDPVRVKGAGSAPTITQSIRSRLREGSGARTGSRLRNRTVAGVRRRWSACQV